MYFIRTLRIHLSIFFFSKNRPLTRGGNLPFRRLCADFGMDASVSEMIYARSLLRGKNL